MKIIQVSDIHMSKPGFTLHGLDPGQRLRSAIADINRRQADADLCIVTGDLTESGEIEAYERVRASLSRLTIPYQVMLGNHDNREQLVHVFPEVTQDENGFLQSVFEYPLGVFILLDTVEPGVGWGSFCEQRVAWLTKQLEAAAGRPVYLFMHHPPFDIGIPSLDVIKLRDATQFTAVIEGFPNIKHLFFGHVHRPVSGSWRGIPFSALKAINQQVCLDLHNSHPVPLSHESPNYAVILLQPDQTTVHFHDYLDQSEISVEQRGLRPYSYPHLLFRFIFPRHPWPWHPA